MKKSPELTLKKCSRPFRGRHDNLGVNTISNIATKLWSMVSIYLFIPLYLQILGETAYGLVSFFATLQFAMNLLGLGLSNTLRREFAVGGNTDSSSARKYKLLRSVELIYIVLGIFISVICSVGSGLIAERWLNIEALDSVLVSTVLSLMGISIALQMIANLYAGCLFGLDLQVRANVYCIVWSMAKSCGALLIIFLGGPDLIRFYSWHILVDILYLLVLRSSVVKSTRCGQQVKWAPRDITNLSSIWKYTLGILVISLIALVNKELDKVIISGYLTLTELGAYNIAVTLGSLTTIFSSAISITMFPRFVKATSLGERDWLQQEFTNVNRLVNLILSCMGAFIAFFALPLIQVWTRTSDYQELLRYVAPLVVLAVASTEFQQIPYALALANNDTKINVLLGGISVPFVAVFTYYAITRFGLPGAGAVYFAAMLAESLIYEILVYRKYLDGSAVGLVLRDTIVPLALSLVMAYGCKAFVSGLTDNALMESLLAVLSGAISLAILILLFERAHIKSFLKLMRGGSAK